MAYLSILLNTMIKKMEKQNLAECARLHYSSIKNSFLCDIGYFFIKKIYAGIVKSADCAGYIYLDNSEIVGFITGSKNTGKFMRNMILKNFLFFAPYVGLKILIKPHLIKKVFETLFYSKKSGADNTKAELVSIVVMSNQRGKGIGKKLFNELVLFFKANNISKFKVMVGKNNTGANKFYESLGFNFSSTFNLYGQDMNIYTYNIYYE